MVGKQPTLDELAPDVYPRDPVAPAPPQPFAYSDRGDTWQSWVPEQSPAPTPPMKRVVDAILAVTAGGADLLKTLDRAERIERLVWEWREARIAVAAMGLDAGWRLAKAEAALSNASAHLGGYEPGAIR